MSIPPPNRPSSTPPGKKSEGPEHSKSNKGKPFELPQRKGEGESQNFLKKNLHDKENQTPEGVVDQFGQIKLQSQPFEAQEGISKVGGIEKTQEVAQLARISALIKTMVSEMKIHSAEQTTLVQATLKEGPPSFHGAHLAISFEKNALSIQFTNFATPQDQQNAIALVEKNKAQLVELQQTLLAASNVRVQEIRIGEHRVALPRVEPLPRPFETTQSQRSETGLGREGGRQPGEGGPPGKPPVGRGR